MTAARGDREFAVLVPFVEVEGATRILLTVRPERDGDHYSGQVCFPGGAREDGDTTLADCALRETREELGVPPSRVEILGELDWHRTAVSHRVKPFVGRLHLRSPRSLRPGGDEVDRVLFLPAERLSAELFETRGTFRDDDGETRTIYRFDLDGFEVWGLTARILRTLCARSDDLLARLVAGPSGFTRGGA